MKFTFVLGLAAVVLAYPGGAFAACDPQGELICGTGTPRVGPEAGLQVSRGGNFSPLASGAGLRGGDRVLAGEGGATVVLGPSCTTTVGPGALVSFTRSGGRTCASVTEPLPAPGTVTGGLGATPIGLGLAAGAAGAVGLGLALSGGNGRPLPFAPTVSAQ